MFSDLFLRGDGRRCSGASGSFLEAAQKKLKTILTDQESLVACCTISSLARTQQLGLSELRIQEEGHDTESSLARWAEQEEGDLTFGGRIKGLAAASQFTSLLLKANSI